MKVIGIIPARYKSSRFPGKPIVEILGKPLIIHVAEKVEQALGKENTYIATDHDRIARTVKEYGYQVIDTSSNALTGTDRIWEAAQQVEADIYVNVQGDEPMINPDDILKAVEVKKQYMDMVINGMHPLAPGEDPHDVNIPKVLVNKHDELIYMSRLPIPGIKRQFNGGPDYLKQVCIYVFTYDQLKAYGETQAKAEYENFEDIEILRFFDLGIRVKMIPTSKVSLAVDMPGDVEKVERALRKELGI